MQRERCAQAARKSLFGRRPRYRHAPGSLALREIRKYQKSTDTLIPKVRVRCACVSCVCGVRACVRSYFVVSWQATFSRLTRQLTLEIKPGHRWTKTAVDALQQAAEAFVVGVLEEANLCAIHGKRVTIMDRGTDYDTTHDTHDTHNTHDTRSSAQLITILPGLWFVTADIALTLRLRLKHTIPQ